MWPGTRVAKATSPGAPMARYSVMKREPPPATRLRAPKKPPPPACWVWVVIWTEADIQESSPASEMTASLGPRANSRTGMVVPRMRFCMRVLLGAWKVVRRRNERLQYAIRKSMQSISRAVELSFGRWSSVEAWRMLRLMSAAGQVARHARWGRLEELALFLRTSALRRPEESRRECRRAACRRWARRRRLTPPSLNFDEVAGGGATAAGDGCEVFAFRRRRRGGRGEACRWARSWRRVCRRLTGSRLNMQGELKSVGEVGGKVDDGLAGNRSCRLWWRRR